MYMRLLSRNAAQLVTILNASFAHAAATIALVDAIAGMIFLITPCVCIKVTPGMLNCFARANAWVYTQPWYSGSSLSGLSSGKAFGCTGGQAEGVSGCCAAARSAAWLRGGLAVEAARTFGYSIKCA